MKLVEATIYFMLPGTRVKSRVKNRDVLEPKTLFGFGFSFMNLKRTEVAPLGQTLNIGFPGKLNFF